MLKRHVMGTGNIPSKLGAMERIKLAIENEDLEKEQIVLLIDYEPPTEKNDFKHIFIFGWFDVEGSYLGKYSSTELTDKELWIRFIPDLNVNKLPKTVVE